MPGARVERMRIVSSWARCGIAVGVLGAAVPFGCGDGSESPPAAGSRAARADAADASSPDVADGSVDASGADRSVDTDAAAEGATNDLDARDDASDAGIDGDAATCPGACAQDGGAPCDAGLLSRAWSAPELVHGVAGQRVSTPVVAVDALGNAMSVWIEDFQGTGPNQNRYFGSRWVVGSGG
jgi:hypothetical protein